MIGPFSPERNQRRTSGDAQEASGNQSVTTRPSGVPSRCSYRGSSGGRVLRLLVVGLAEGGEDLAGDVALEAPHDLSAGPALGGAAGGVVAGGLVPAQSDEHDPVEGGVGLPVAAAVEPMPDGLAGGRLDRAGTAQRREGGVA